MFGVHWPWLVRAELPTSPRSSCHQFQRTALGASGDATLFGAEHRMDQSQRAQLLLHVTLPSEEDCERLRVAVMRAAERSAESMGELRDAVRRFTVVLRDEGTTPERVLISLKSIIYNRSFPTIITHPTEWASGSRLHEKISTWCIEEYFSETPT